MYLLHLVLLFLGTSLLYHPGILIGGKVEHDCNLQRSIGYFLEVILCLAPFMKNPVHALLTGITNDQVDPSVSICPVRGNCNKSGQFKYYSEMAELICK